MMLVTSELIIEKPTKFSDYIHAIPQPEIATLDDVIDQTELDLENAYFDPRNVDFSEEDKEKMK